MRIFDHALENREIEIILNHQQHLSEQFSFERISNFSTHLKSIEYRDNLNLILGGLEKSQLFDQEEINTLALTIEASLDFRDLLDFFNPQIQECLKLLENKVLRSIRKIIQSDGTINYSSHPELSKLHQDLYTIEQKTRQFLEQYQSNPETTKLLQYAGQDLINDHYTLAIKADHYHGKIGTIISRSSTGHTLHIEPFEVRSLNYQRLEIKSQITEVLIKIFREITHRLEGLTLELNQLLESLYFYDSIWVRVAFAKKYQLIRPHLTEKKCCKFYGLRHPLIKDAVKNNINIDENKKGIIISGPNTGGKTATLKALALSILFTKHGLFVPADEAHVFAYQEIFYFGNDRQNLEEGLSSFAAEVKNYLDLQNELKASNIIFIDEIFNSTSSDEASALSLALLEAIHEQQFCHIILSTHHQMLKTYMHNKTDYLSAHVGFNDETHSPTYKLHFGIPGSSMALEIFSLLTKSREECAPIYKNAIKYLDSKHISYETLLQKVASKQNQLDNLLTQNRNLENELKNQKKAMEGVLELKLAQKLEAADNKIVKILEKARHLQREAKKANKSTKVFEKEAHLIKSELQTIAPLGNKDNASISQNLTYPSHYVEGDLYYSKTLNTNVVLQTLYKDNKTANVVKGIIKSKVSLNDLYVAKGNNQNKKTKQGSHHFVSHREAQINYDCRGMRLEEFQSLVEWVVTDLLSGSIPYLAFVHGHGDGILKKWIRDFAKKNKHLNWEQGEHGNDGETRLLLK